MYIYIYIYIYIYRFKREKKVAWVIEYDSLTKTLKKRSRRVHTKFTEKEHFLFGKYTAINGPGAAV